MKKFCKRGHKRDVFNTYKSRGCKECYRISWKFWKSKHPLAKREYDYKHKYGITLTDFNTILIIQKNLCAICGKEKKLVLDHDHKTGLVRGALCLPCNTILGMANDDIKKLFLAIEYLNRSNTRWTRKQRK